MHVRSGQQDESGFTLIELLVATVVLGLLSSGVAACIMLFFKTADGTSRRFDYSHDSQLLATYLTPDLESLGNTPGPPKITRANSSSCPVGSSSFSDLQINFSDGQLPVTDYEVHYTVNGSVITRTFKATGASTLQNTNELVHNLKRPDLACFSNAPVAPWTWTMTVTTGSPTDSNPSDDYTFSVTAGGRVTYPPPDAPVLLPEDDSGIKGDSITNVNRPTFTGHARPGDIVELFDDQSLMGTSAPVGLQGNYSVDVNPRRALFEGNNNMTATATDQAGDISVPSAATSVIIDTVEAPPSTLVLAPASRSCPTCNTITNVNTPSFEGTAENNLNSTLAIVTLFDGKNKTPVGTGTSKDGSYTAAINSTTPLGPGSHTITAKTTDAAGNTSHSSPPLVITVDTAAPTIDLPITTGSLGTGKATGALGTETDDIPAATFAIYLGNPTTGNKVQGGFVVTITWSVSWTGLIPGRQYTIVVTQTDQAGNMGSAQQAFTEP